MELFDPQAHTARMTGKVRPRFKKPPNRYFFREWRKYRGMTQEDLAAATGLSAPSISQLETGKQGFTDSTLEAIAEALHCGPGDLLMRNPLDKDAPWSIWDKIPASERATALRTLASFAKDGTNG